MTWDNNATDLTERIRYLQEWTPSSQRHRLERPRSPYKKTKDTLAEIHKTLADGKRSLGDFYALPNLREEMATLKKRIESLSAENNALRKSRRELESTLAQTKRELADSEAEAAASEFAATEARARVDSLDQDVEKLCELSKLLTQENGTLRMQKNEKEVELQASKSREELLQRKGDAMVAKLKEQNAEQEEILFTIKGEKEVLEKELEELREEVKRLRKCEVEKEGLEEELERLKGLTEVSNGGPEAPISSKLAKVELEKEELRKQLAKLEAELTKVAVVAERKEAEMAEMEEEMAEYEGELKHLSEDVERAAEEAATERARADNLEAKLAEEQRRRWRTTPDTTQLRRQISAVLFYRQSSADADKVVSAEFDKMTAALAGGLHQLEAEIAAWKQKVGSLEEALKLANEAAASSQRAATGLLDSVSELGIDGRSSTRNMGLPVNAIVPATVASGALAGGLYAAVKLLQASKSTA